MNRVKAALRFKSPSSGTNTGKPYIVIYRDEQGHVAIGSHWFKHCCAERGLPYRATFAELLSGYLKATIKGPFNVEARLQAGFDDLEIAMLEEIAEQ